MHTYPWSLPSYKHTSDIGLGPHFIDLGSPESPSWKPCFQVAHMDEGPPIWPQFLFKGLYLQIIRFNNILDNTSYKYTDNSHF